MFGRQLFTRAALRGVAISIAYLILWIGLDLLVTGRANSKTLNPWYLSAALTFYLVYTCGPRYAPLAVLAEVLRACLPIGHHQTPWFALNFGLLDAAGYTFAAHVTRNVLRVNLPFVRLRDAARFCAVAALAPLTIGACVIAVLCLIGFEHWYHYFTRVLTFWVGDSVGLFVLVPLLALYVTPYLAPWMVSPEARDDEVPISAMEGTILYAVLVLSLGIEYAAFLTGISQYPLLYFTFLPLVWMASRGGLQMAIPGIVCADVMTTILNGVFPSPNHAAIELQSYIVVSAMSSLAIGALVNDHHRRNRRARLIALRDPLTGLANRLSLEGWMRDATVPFTLLVMDIDRMKLANDGLNRRDGDELLRLVAQRLQFLEASFIAHVGPDQFACVFGGEQPAAQLAGSVHSLFDEPFAIEESEVYISAAMGISTATRAADRTLSLRRADVALYRAKQRGRTGYSIYTTEMEASESNLSLAAELHRAFREHEFLLYYQPLYRCEGGDCTCIGAEALLRWQHPELGLLEPAAFLDLLESLALAERVGEWVVDEACRQLHEWTQRGLDLSVWVNVFPRQALDPNFQTVVTKALLDYRIKPERLVLEIVERVFGEDEREVSEAILGLRGLGVRVAIDDFGTGHSSLARLRESPAHIMKIDGSFVERSDIDPRARGVVHAVMQIAQEMRVTPLAEGIESEAQLRLVTGLGCQLVQGYYLARPMPPHEVDGVARTFSSRDTFDSV